MNAYEDFINRLLLFLVAVPIVFLISAGSVLTVATGFDLNASISFVIVFSLIYSLFACLPYLFRKPWPMLIVVIVFSAFMIYGYHEPIYGGMLFSYKQIMRLYANTFPVLESHVPTYHVFLRVYPELFFCCIAMPIAHLTAASIFGRIPVLIPVLISVPMLALCMIAMDTVPDVLPLVMLTIAYVFLVVTRSGRTDFILKPTLQLIMLLPIAVLVLLLALITRPNSYEKPEWTGFLQEKFQLITDKLPGPGMSGHDAMLGGQGWNSSPEVADLKNVGAQKLTGKHVMDVYSNRSGLHYLKGAAYSDYTGTSWTNPTEQELNEDFFVPGREVWFSTDRAAEYNLTIRTDEVVNTLYVPANMTSYPSAARPITDLRLYNRRGVKEYGVAYSNKPLEYSEDYAAYVFRHFLSLPESTREALDEMRRDAGNNELFQILNSPNPGELDEEIPGYDEDVLVQNIVSYVRDSAYYDLNTPAMPEDEEDFAIWFLREQERGYCIHFATAAAVLLRYKGIPARFVTGYAADSLSNRWASVTEDSAHAWVEYFSNDAHWVRLEPTPAAAGNPIHIPTSEEEITEPGREHTEPRSSSIETTAPSSGEISPGQETGPDGNDVPGSRERFSIDWRILLGIGILIVLLLLQLIGRLLLRRYLHEGSRNQQAIHIYRRMRSLTRLTRRTIPKEAEDIALKARFSRHVITKEELAAIRRQLEILETQMKEEHPRIKGLLNRLLFFI